MASFREMMEAEMTGEKPKASAPAPTPAPAQKPSWMPQSAWDYMRSEGAKRTGAMRSAPAQAMTDAFNSAVDSANFGLGPYAEGGFEAAKTAIGAGRPGETAGQAYERRRQEVVKARTERQKRSPVADTVGNIGGAVAGAFVPGVALEKTTATLVPQVMSNTKMLVDGLKGMSLGAVQAAIAGLGYGQPKTMDEAMEIIAKNGGIGAMVAGTLGVSGGVAAKVVNWARAPVQKQGTMALADELTEVTTKRRASTMDNLEFGGPEGGGRQIQETLKTKVLQPGKTVGTPPDPTKVRGEFRAKRDEQLRILDDAKTKIDESYDRILEARANLAAEQLKARKIAEGYQKYVDDELQRGGKPMSVDQWKQQNKIEADVAGAQREYEAVRNAEERIQGQMSGKMMDTRKALDDMDEQERLLLQGTTPTPAAQTKMETQAVEYGPSTAITANDPTNTKRYFMGTLEEGTDGQRLGIGYVNSGGQPGMGREIAGVVEKAGGRPSSITSGNIINWETLDQLNRGYPARDTLVGRFRENIGENLGKNASSTWTRGNTPDMVGMETRLTGAQGPRQYVATPDELASANVDAPATLLDKVERGRVIADKLRKGEALTAEETAIANEFVNTVNQNRRLPRNQLEQVVQNNAGKWGELAGSGAGAAVGGAVGGAVGALGGATVGATLGRTIKGMVPQRTPLPFKQIGEGDIKGKDPMSLIFPKTYGVTGDITSRQFITQPEFRDDDLPPAIRDILNQTDSSVRMKNKESETQENIVTEDGIRYQILPDGTKIRIQE